MKHNEYTEAFGASPDAFRARVAGTLEELTSAEERQTRRHLTPRAVILLTLIAALLLGMVSYAAVSRFGLQEYHERRFGSALPSTAHDALLTDKPYVQGTVGDLLNVEISEAFADGRTVYLTVLLTPRVEGDILLLGNEGIQWGAETTEQTQRYITSVNASIDGVEQEFPYNQFYPIEERGIAYMVQLPQKSANEALEISCEVSYRPADKYNEPTDGPEVTDKVAFVLPVTDTPLEEKTIAVNATIDDIALTIEDITLTKTPITTYIKVGYTIGADATEEQREIVLDHFGIYFHEKTDEGWTTMLFQGAGEYSYTNDGMGHFTMEQSVNLETWPEVLVLVPEYTDQYEGISVQYDQIEVPLSVE